jgi:serine protease
VLCCLYIRRHFRVTNCMKNSVRLTCLIILPLIARGNAASAVIHVPADQPTIQQAIDVAQLGDTVLVSPGTYFENIDFHGKAISVKSQRGSAQTIIDGNNTGFPVVSFESGETRKSALSGFTIQHGTASDGAGVSLFAASATITRNIFRENGGLGEFGAAILGNISSPVVEGNTFIDNTCDAQDASSVVSFANDSHPLIINNIFVNNPCRAMDMTLPAEGAPTVANNTIVGNRVGVFIDLFGSPAAHLYANNIIVGNEVGLEIEGSGDELPWENNLVFGNTTNYTGITDQTGLNGNISVNPRFVSLAKLNFQLRRASPAIDAGTLSVPHLPAIDFAGNPRVVDGNGDGTALPDIGAFEFVP